MDWTKIQIVLTSNSSSKTFVSFFFFMMPFSCANFSHLVGGRGTGHFFMRGKTNDGAGNLATIHSSTRSVGCSHNAFTINCTLSLVNSAKYSSFTDLKMVKNEMNRSTATRVSMISTSNSLTSIESHPNHLDLSTINIPNQFLLPNVFPLESI